MDQREITGQKKKSRLGHGCLSLFIVVCRQVEVCVGLITSPGESYRVCLIVCDLDNLTMRRLGLELGCCATE
jgi:hypothetical protein